MNRTPEHEQMIDDIVDHTGLPRAFVEKVADNFIEKLIDHTAKKMLEQLTGAPVVLPAGEYLIPKRDAGRFRREARAIRERARNR